MNWPALKNMRCPKCGNALKKSGMLDIMYECIGECEFKIGDAKFTQIINDMYKPRKVMTDEQRLSELNNYGRKKITDDFSDSPYL